MGDMFVVLSTGIIEARVAALTDASRLTDGRTVVNASVYSESMPGAVLVWPRAWRDALLAATDWMLTADAPLTAEQVSAARAYRTALRNLSATCPEAASVTWPAPLSF